ncbi:MAG: glycine--tRNA ligase, partial [Verrucomicrobiota bacterium]
GHTSTFSDPMVDCLLTKKRFRADQIEPQSGRVVRFVGAFKKPAETTPASGTTMEGSPAHRAIERWLKRTQQPLSTLTQKDLINEFLDLAKENPPVASGLVPFSEDRAMSYAQVGLSLLITNAFSVLLLPGKPLESATKTAIQFYDQLGFKEAFPICVDNPQPIENSTDFHPESLVELGPARPFNLMFKTYVGPVESEDNVAYLRPETAQAIFAQFKNVLETCRQKVPFGIAQVGKAFRNEVTPRNFTFRSREFEQMELEFFIKPDEVVEAISGNVASLSEAFGVPPSGGSEPAKAGTPNQPQPNWGWQAWHQYWVEERVKFYEGIGLSRQTLGFHIQTAEELAHYARACTDILFKFPFSKKDDQGNAVGDELEGIAARSDFDLSQHERFSGKPMGVFDDELRGAWAKLDDAKKQELSQRYYEARLKYLTKSGVEQVKAEKQAKENADGLAKGQYIPHVIEPSAGVDRLILALISNAYSEVTETDDKGKSETRVVMKFHPRVAPIKVAIFPLLKNKPELVKRALAVRDLVRPHMNVFYDDGGSIGRRYARQDEAGTPFCITVDFETFEGVKEGSVAGEKDTVTIRYRDDGRQERAKISELLPWLLEKIR